MSKIRDPRELRLHTPDLGEIRRAVRVAARAAARRRRRRRVVAVAVGIVIDEDAAQELAPQQAGFEEAEAARQDAAAEGLPD